MLPSAPPNPPSGPPAGARSGTRSHPPAAPFRGTVLVIDDSEVARAQIICLLTDAGMEAFGIASPVGAVRAIHDHDVSVVVIDVVMPSMRGDRLAAALRGSEQFRELGLVLVTGETGEEFERLSRSTTADAVISKARLHELAPAVHRARVARARAAAREG